MSKPLRQRTRGSQPAEAHRGGLGAATLFPLVYAELRSIADRHVRAEPHGATLVPTVLVHEAYLKLQRQDRALWAGRTHFLAVAALAMRRILVDQARGRRRLKRGEGLRRITLSEDVAISAADRNVDILDLNGALERLSALDERAATVVELRFFGGLDEAEVAERLEVSLRTVQGDWAHARAWLRRELAGLRDEIDA